MIHLVDNPKMRVRNKTATISSGQMREIAKAVSQMIAVTVAEFPSKIRALLNLHQVQVNEKTSEKNLIREVIEKLSENNPVFNSRLESLIHMAIPDLAKDLGYDNFGEQPQPFGGGTRIFGGSSGFKGFGGGSSGSKLIDGAKTIGTSTASGAAGGGIVGAALGAIGGIFGFANSAKQQKIEKEKASAMTLSSMLQYKAAKLGSKFSGEKNMTLIVISILALIGIIVTVVVIKRNKKAATWKVEQA